MGCKPCTDRPDDVYMRTKTRKKTHSRDKPVSDLYLLGTGSESFIVTLAENDTLNFGSMDFSGNFFIEYQ